MSREFYFLYDVIQDAKLSTNGEKDTVLDLLLLLLSRAKGGIKLELLKQTSPFLRHKSRFTLSTVQVPFLTRRYAGLRY